MSADAGRLSKIMRQTLTRLANGDVIYEGGDWPDPLWRDAAMTAKPPARNTIKALERRTLVERRRYERNWWENRKLWPDQVIILTDAGRRVAEGGGDG